MTAGPDTSCIFQHLTSSTRLVSHRRARVVTTSDDALSCNSDDSTGISSLRHVISRPEHDVISYVGSPALESAVLASELTILDSPHTKWPDQEIRG
jgi:hypothetical protein